MLENKGDVGYQLTGTQAGYAKGCVDGLFKKLGLPFAAVLATVAHDDVYLKPADGMWRILCGLVTDATGCEVDKRNSICVGHPSQRTGNVD